MFACADFFGLPGNLPLVGGMLPHDLPALPTQAEIMYIYICICICMYVCVWELELHMYSIRKSVCVYIYIYIHFLVGLDFWYAS